MDATHITSPQAQEPVSVGEWIIAYILQAIPIVGIVMLFIWAFGEGAKPSKANWAKAMLILIGISLVLGICIWVAVFAIFGNSMNWQTTY